MSLFGRRTSELLPGTTDSRRRSYLERCTTRRLKHGWSPQGGNDKIHTELSIDPGYVAGSVYLTRSVRSLSHIRSGPSWTSSRSPRGKGTGYKPQVRQIQTHSRLRKSLSILVESSYRIVMLNKNFGKFHTTAREDYESCLAHGGRQQRKQQDARPTALASRRTMTGCKHIDDTRFHQAPRDYTKENDQCDRIMSGIGWIIEAMSHNVRQVGRYVVGCGTDS